MVWALCALGACAFFQEPAEVEIRLFALAVEETVRDSEALHFIDPRIVDLTDERVFPDLSSEALGLNSDEGSAARARELQALRVEVAPAFPFLDGCDGFLFPPPRETDGCPSETRSYSIFSRATADRDVGKIRRFTIQYRSEGRSASLAEFTFARGPEGWIVTAVTTLVVWD